MALSDDLKLRIIHWYYEEKMTMRGISGLARCSLGVVHKVIQNYQEFGEVNNPFTQAAQCEGRPRYLTNEDISFIAAVI